MLVAFNEKAEIVLASEVSKSLDNGFLCPCCQTSVILKIGKKTIPHFAHKSLAECNSASENESLTHMIGKLDLFRRFRKISETCELEKYIPEINQRTDVAARRGKENYAIEFQCSNISTDLITKRTLGYKSTKMSPIWIFNSELLNKGPSGSYKLNCMLQSSINENARLFIYDVKRKNFIILSKITPFSRTNFFANEITVPLDKINFKDLITSSYEKPTYLKHWNNKRDQYINGIRYEGLKYPFNRMLYESGIAMQNLPYFVGVLLEKNFLLRTPPIEWQGIIFLELLTMKQVTKSDLKEMWDGKIRSKSFLVSDCSETNQICHLTLLSQYISILVYVGFLKRVDNDKYAVSTPVNSNRAKSKLNEFLLRKYGSK